MKTEWRIADRGQQAFARRVGRHLVFQVDGQPARREIAEVSFERGPIHHQHAAIVRVVEVHRGEAEGRGSRRRRHQHPIADVGVVLQRERLGRDHGVLPDRAAHRRRAVRRGLEQQGAVREDHVEVTRAHANARTAVRHVCDPESIDGENVRARRDRPHDVGRERGFGRRPARRGRTDEQIGLQRLAGPVDDGLTKAAHHDRDGDHHRQAHGERGHRD